MFVIVCLFCWLFGSLFVVVTGDFLCGFLLLGCILWILLLVQLLVMSLFSPFIVDHLSTLTMLN